MNKDELDILRKIKKKGGTGCYTPNAPHSERHRTPIALESLVRKGLVVVTVEITDAGRKALS